MYNLRNVYGEEYSLENIHHKDFYVKFILISKFINITCILYKRTLVKYIIEM